jgi:hypothetical protein
VDDHCPEMDTGWHGGCVATAMRVAVTLKNESFKEEREWRLISMPQMIDSLDFRQGTSTLIPFFKFALNEDRNIYLDSVLVGPSPNSELALRSVQMLLAQVRH